MINFLAYRQAGIQFPMLQFPDIAGWDFPVWSLGFEAFNGNCHRLWRGPSEAGEIDHWKFLSGILYLWVLCFL
jgi:hypothetical protein